MGVDIEKLPPVAEDDKHVPVAAALEAAYGYRPTPPTVWRYCTKGRRGIPLPHVKIGGRRLTTVNKARKWAEQTTAPIPAQSDTRKELERELAS